MMMSFHGTRISKRKPKVNNQTSISIYSKETVPKISVEKNKENENENEEEDCSSFKDISEITHKDNHFIKESIQNSIFVESQQGTKQNPNGK